MTLSYTPLTDDVSKEMQDACIGAMPAGEVVVTPPGVVLTKNFKNYAQRLQNLEVREDDIWLISFPKCGSTWNQEMIWLLKHNIDFEAAKSVYLHMRFPFLDYKPLWSEGNEEPDTIGIIENMPSPRLIKTHLPVELLPKDIWIKKPKIVYVSRNPKDAAISYFHHFRLWNNYSGDMELFLRAFVEDKVVFSPFWNHVMSYWKLRNDENVHFMSFEDMKKDLATSMKDLADFLGETYTKDQEAALLDHLSFASMKNNKSVNFEDEIKRMRSKETFIREGQAGSWKKSLSPEFVKLFDKWTDRYLQGTDYPRTNC